LLSARAKHGFGWHSGGYLVPLSKNSRHIYDLGLSDELKFEQNKKSYQQLIIEACGLEYKQQEYVLNLTQTEKDWATGYLKSLRAFNRKKYLLGINTGAGKAFPTKAWPSEHIIKLYTLMKGNRDIGILLLGGDEERDLNKKILGKCPGMLTASNNLDLRQFASVIDRLDVLVSSDTLAMHIGIALEKQVVALFGPTSAQEIDLYGKGVKLESKIDCAPCYRTMCKDTVCMAGISPESVMAAVKRFLKT
jgi:heptosyltransferase-2